MKTAPSHFNWDDAPGTPSFGQRNTVKGLKLLIFPAGDETASSVVSLQTPPSQAEKLNSFTASGKAKPPGWV